MFKPTNLPAAVELLASGGLSVSTLIPADVVRELVQSDRSPGTRAIECKLGGESELIAMAMATTSEANWVVGRMAATWMTRFSRGRPLSDFAEMVGLESRQVKIRKDVWNHFSDVRKDYPHLLWSHFHAALQWDDWKEVLTWANDLQATVAEMRAWRRAQHGEDLSALPEEF